MSEHAAEHGGTKRLFVWVWAWLVLISAIEVYLAYIHLQPAELMLALLLGFSVIKAGLILSYFMHLRFEKLGLVLFLIPALIFCILMMNLFFPDALRLRP